MLKRLDTLYMVKEVIGISITLEPEGSLFNLCHLQRQGDGMDIVERRSFADTNGLFAYLDAKKSLPISLHVQGRGVLIKQLEAVESLTLEHILTVFPNYSEETYANSYFGGEQTAWLALMRKEPLGEILQSFRERGLDIVRVFIGPGVVDNVLDQLNGYSGNYLFDGHHIQRDTETGRWQSYRYEKGAKATYAIKAQGMDMSEHAVMSYAAAFSLLMHRFVPDMHVDIAGVDERFEDLLQRLRFRTNGMLVLAVFFMLLLINSMLYVHYQGRYEALDYQSRENFSNVNELERLSTSVSANDTLLRQIGWNGGLPKSWIANQLAKSLEGRTGIEWREMEINPYSVRRLGAIIEEADHRYRISVTGECLSLRELERWVRTLGHKPWVEQVEISRFVDQNNPNATGKDFVVTLHYTYDF